MITPAILRSSDNTLLARIDQGELISLSLHGNEFIHQKGNPGWGSSDTEMFPIIGPTAHNGYQVKTERGLSKMDQHGILRELPYTLIHQQNDQIQFRKEYTANTRVPNSKFPERSPIDEVYWSFDFMFTKTFKIIDRELHIRFEIEGEKNMPYMLGYHPAFLLSGRSDDLLETGNDIITLNEIMAAGSKAYHIPDCEMIMLKRPDQKNLRIKTTGFRQFMLWTEVENMLCIEPITFYPDGGKQKQRFNIMGEDQKAVYETILIPEVY